MPLRCPRRSRLFRGRRSSHRLPRLRAPASPPPAIVESLGAECGLGQKGPLLGGGDPHVLSSDRVFSVNV